ncbi:hypothetical protein [Poseidonibacter antarcticus]|nr:hypothetical protein [Poseidonibacter antarcticus]
MKEYLHEPKKLKFLAFEVRTKLEKKKNASFFQKFKKFILKK